MPLDAIKVLLGERAGQEIDITEYSLSAATLPFTNVELVASDTESAIMEVKHKIRMSDQAGFSTGSNGRWLCRVSDVPSNEGPLHIASARVLKELSFTASANATATVTVWKNPRGTPVVAATLSLSASKSARTDSLSVSFAAGDEVGYQITSGSCSRPSVTAEFEKS